jgi:hypothetical protein
MVPEVRDPVITSFTTRLYSHLMYVRIIIIAVMLFATTLRATGQHTSPAPSRSDVPAVDKPTKLMQDMIVKLIVEAGSDFKNIKGAEISRQEGGPVSYKAMISYLAKDDEERGAMLTQCFPYASLLRKPL